MYIFKNWKVYNFRFGEEVDKLLLVPLTARVTSKLVKYKRFGYNYVIVPDLYVTATPYVYREIRNVLYVSTLVSLFYVKKYAESLGCGIAFLFEKLRKSSILVEFAKKYYIVIKGMTTELTDIEQEFYRIISKASFSQVSYFHDVVGFKHTFTVDIGIWYVYKDGRKVLILIESDGIVYKVHSEGDDVLEEIMFEVLTK